MVSKQAYKLRQTSREYLFNLLRPLLAATFAQPLGKSCAKVLYLQGELARDVADGGPLRLL